MKCVAAVTSRQCHTSSIPALWRNLTAVYNVNTPPVICCRGPSSLLVFRRTCCSAIGDRAFPVAVTRLWNTLPQNVTSAPSLTVFKKCLKTHHFNRLFPRPQRWHVAYMAVVVVGPKWRARWLTSYLSGMKGARCVRHHELRPLIGPVLNHKCVAVVVDFRGPGGGKEIFQLSASIFLPVFFPFDIFGEETVSRVFHSSEPCYQDCSHIGLSWLKSPWIFCANLWGSLVLKFMKNTVLKFPTFLLLGPLK